MKPKPTAAASRMPPAAANVSPLSVARQQDAASYITALVYELRQISVAAGLNEITVHLEQAFYEASKLIPRLNEPEVSLSQMHSEAGNPNWTAE